MPKVKCITLHGQYKTVDAETLILRASAYGVVLYRGQVLLTQMKSTLKYYLPGGGSRLGETLEAAVIREVREETGIMIRVHKLLYFQEDFFYYDPFDEAYHSLLFYYECSPLTFDILPDDQVHDQEATHPQWKSISNLQPENFQNHGEMILSLVHFLQTSEG